MRSINSLLKKGKTILSNGNDGIDAIKEGINNYNNINPEVEKLAQERINICVGCEFYKDEPNQLLKVDDSLVVEADQMMCNECGCSLPYKIRQSKLKCFKWSK